MSPPYPAPGYAQTRSPDTGKLSLARQAIRAWSPPARKCDDAELQTSYAERAACVIVLRIAVHAAAQVVQVLAGISSSARGFARPIGSGNAQFRAPHLVLQDGFEAPTLGIAVIRERRDSIRR